MTTFVETQLFKATALTFEQLGFMFASPDVQEEQMEIPAEVAMRVDFEGSFKGRLVLAVAGGILPAVVSNMVGKEEHVANAQEDALGEMANVICGSVLTGIAGDDETFLLSAPRPVPPAESADKSGGTPAGIRIGLEGGRADVLLVIEGAVPERLGAETP